MNNCFDFQSKTMTDDYYIEVGVTPSNIYICNINPEGYRLCVCLNDQQAAAVRDKLTEALEAR